jgi:hypothetical protein
MRVQMDSKSWTSPRAVDLNWRMLLARARYRAVVPITIKFHVHVALTRKVRYRAAEYSNLRNGCDKSALDASEELRVVRVKSPTRQRRKFRLAIDNSYMAVACIGISVRRSILVGLLKAYLCVGTVARPEDWHRGTSLRRIEDFTGTDAAFAGSSAHEDTCCPAFYNVPSLRRTCSCTMHKNNRQLNFIKIFKEKDRCKCEWTFTHALHRSIGLNMLTWL